jgi:hypothetical protein
MADTRQPARAGEFTRATGTPENIGSTAGDADVTADTVKAKKDTIECPNCHRSWPVRTGDKGSTFPCLCGFLISVA